MCFQGWFVDLSAAGVQPDTNHSLVFTLPSDGGGGNTFPRVGQDMRNGDLPGMPVVLPQPDYMLCWAMCNQTEACVAWAYGDNLHGCTESAAHCWLKQSIGAWDADACRVAGIKAPQPAAFKGVFFDNVDTIYASLL